jgi:hypothetical protein
MSQSKRRTQRWGNVKKVPLKKQIRQENRQHRNSISDSGQSPHSDNPPTKDDRS